MAIVRAILTDALAEIGVVGAIETPAAEDAQLALRYFQRQLDAWRADRLTLSAQRRTVHVVPADTSTVTIQPVAAVPPGAELVMVVPLRVDTLTYLIPGSSPGVEVPIALLEADGWAAVAIKGLRSGLPTEAFYGVSINSNAGILQLWPVPTQDLTIVLYTPEAVEVPASLETVLVAPPGYAEAFHYQLALRLAGPFGVPPRPDLQELAVRAYAVMRRQNVAPGVLGVDPALTGGGGGYNILSDSAGRR